MKLNITAIYKCHIIISNIKGLWRLNCNKSSQIWRGRQIENGSDMVKKTNYEKVVLATEANCNKRETQIDSRQRWKKLKYGKDFYHAIIVCI